MIKLGAEGFSLMIKITETRKFLTLLISSAMFTLAYSNKFVSVLP